MLGHFSECGAGEVRGAKDRGDKKVRQRIDKREQHILFEGVEGVMVMVYAI